MTRSMNALTVRPYSASSTPSFSFTSALIGSAARRIALAWQEIEQAEAADIGPQHQVGRAVLELLGDDGLAHHGDGGEQAFPRIGNARGSRAPPADSRPRRSHRPRRAERSNGSGSTAPPSTRTRPSMLTGRTRPGTAIDAASGGLSGPGANDSGLAARIEVGRDDGERDRQRSEIVGQRRGRNADAELLRHRPASGCRTAPRDMPTSAAARAPTTRRSMSARSWASATTWRRIAGRSCPAA